MEFEIVPKNVPAFVIGHIKGRQESRCWPLKTSGGTEPKAEGRSREERVDGVHYARGHLKERLYTDPLWRYMHLWQLGICVYQGCVRLTITHDPIATDDPRHFVTC